MCYSVVMAEEAAISSLSAVTPLSPLLETGATLKAHLLDGTYQIGRRKPGEGALGQVYTALHGPTHIQYALKRLRPELLAEPERLARLRRQAPQWALLRVRQLHRHRILVHHPPQHRLQVIVRLAKGRAPRQELIA